MKPPCSRCSYYGEAEGAIVPFHKLRNSPVGSMVSSKSRPLPSRLNNYAICLIQICMYIDEVHERLIVYMSRVSFHLIHPCRFWPGLNRAL